MRGQNEITNSADVIDSRDIIDRIAYLTDDRDSYDTAATEQRIEHPDLPPVNGVGNWVEDYPEEAAELAALVALAEEAGGYAPDWTHGVTLIRESYFEDYARELAEDIGAVKDDAAWPCYCIDWERAARELQMDYTSVEFGDGTYWVR